MYCRIKFVILILPNIIFKFYTMKKIKQITAIAISVIAISCSESEIVNKTESVSNHNATFTFSAVEIENPSRADYSEISQEDFTPSNIQMGIFGYKNTSGQYGRVLLPIFENDSTQRYDTDSWFVDKVVAVDPSSEYSFFAYAPYSGSRLDIFSSTDGIIHITVPGCVKVEDGIDYIIAEPITNYTPVINSQDDLTEVPLTFKHLLSRVDFNVSLPHTSYYGINLRKATIALPDIDDSDNGNAYVCNLIEKTNYFQHGDLMVPTLAETTEYNTFDYTDDEIFIAPNKSHCIESYYISPLFQNGSITVEAEIEYDVIYSEGDEPVTIKSQVKVTLQPESNTRYAVNFQVMYNAIVFNIESFNDWNIASESSDAKI